MLQHLVSLRTGLFSSDVVAR